jgi:hypothetical protein
MKIIIQNHKDQFALSRKQVEIVKETMPKEYFIPIREFSLSDDHRNKEVFEYYRKEKIVRYSFVVKEKTTELLKNAVEELLIGLARIKSKSTFYMSLKEDERLLYKPFVDQWLPKCLDAINK